MPIVEPSKSTAPEIEDGLYEILCTGAEERFVTEDAFGKNHKLEIHVDIALPGGEVITLNPLVNYAWAEKATLYMFAKGFGCVTDLSSPFDTDMMIGKRAQALIKTDHEKSAWPKVIDVIALKVNGKSAPTAPQEGAAPWETGDVVAEAEALADWFDALIAIGYKRADIIAHAQHEYTREPKNLTAVERDALATKLRDA